MEGDQIPGLPPQLASLTTGLGLLSVTWVSLILSFYTQALTSSSPVQLLLLFFFFGFHFFFSFLATLFSMWDLSSPTRNHTHAPYVGSGESSPADRQGIPTTVSLIATHF